MRIPPFYTTWKNDPVRDVWHNNDQCPIGQAVPLDERLPGTDHVRERCPRCAALNEALSEAVPVAAEKP